MTIKPYITEKTLKLAKDGVFTFVTTQKHLNKLEIAKRLAKLHNISIDKVSSFNKKPSFRRFRGRAGFEKGFKKLLVKVKKGQKIPGFEVITTDKEGKPRIKEGKK